MDSLSTKVKDKHILNLLLYSNLPILDERLKYHNQQHAERVVNVLNMLTQFSYPLALAAKYHDAIYIAGSSVNEIASADYLRLQYKTLSNTYDNKGVHLNCIETACELITRTTIKDHLSPNCFCKDLEYLLDADLASLADDYSIFIETQQDILFENRESVRDLHKSAKFLSMLGESREFIYRTPEAKLLFEDKARVNIERLIKE